MVIHGICTTNERGLQERSRMQEERLVDESQGEKGNFFNKINWNTGGEYAVQLGQRPSQVGGRGHPEPRDAQQGWRQSPAPGRMSPGSRMGWGRAAWGAALPEGAWWAASWAWACSARAAEAAGGLPGPASGDTARSSPERRDHPSAQRLLDHTQNATSIFRSSAQESHWQTGTGSVESHHDGSGAGAPALWAEAESLEKR